MTPIYQFFFSGEVAPAPKITFARLWWELGEKPGVFERTTVSRLARLCETTEGAMRYHLKALKAAGIVDYVGRGEMTLYVYHPIPSERRKKPNATPLFDALEEMSPAETEATVKESLTVPMEAEATNEESSVVPSEIPSEQNSENPRNLPNDFPNDLPTWQTPSSITRARAAKEKININKTSFLAKKERKEGMVERQESDAGVRSAGEVRTMIDFGAPEVAAYRERVVREVWEWGISVDLVDRITAAAFLNVPGLAAADLTRLVRSARRRDREKLWMGLNPEVKIRFRADGWRYPPCSSTPEPEPRPAVISSGRRTPSVPSAASDSSANPPTADELLARTRGLDVPDGEPLDATARRVMNLEGWSGEFWDAKGTALEIRAAWKQLKKLNLEVMS